MSFKNFYLIERHILNEMPHFYFKGKGVDFYAEKDIYWLVDKFVPFVEKNQHDKEFVEELKKNKIIHLLVKKSYNSLPDNKKKIFNERILKNIREFLLGDNK